MELYNSTSANPKHTLPLDVILRRTTFSQPILPPGGPMMRPDFLLRLWRYINLLLTYVTHCKYTSLKSTFSELQFCR